MVSNRNKYITGSITTLVSLLLWFSLSYHFDFEIEGNKVCKGTFDDPCEASINITLTNPVIKYFYIRNNNAVKLDFVPNVEASYFCKKDGRFRSLNRLDREQYPCGVGYREFDWKTPLTSRYKYIEKFTRGKKHEYKLVVFKFNPEDEIKWGGKITGEDIDPKFLPPFTPIIECDTVIRTAHDICDRQVIKYYNYTDIDNFTKVNISKQRREYINLTVRCNPHDVSEKINCKTVGLNMSSGLKLSCPTGYRCDVNGINWCYVSLDDGDKNFEFTKANGRGWDGDCIKIANLKEGRIKVSSYRNIYMKVEK